MVARATNTYELVGLDALREHERIDIEHYEELLRDISRNRYIVPIVVDSNSGVILDGHHRFKIADALGLSMIPAIIVDYSDPQIEVDSWRKDVVVTKEEVVWRGLNKKLYPPKTSRHDFNGNGIKVPLHKLRGIK